MLHRNEIQELLPDGLILDQLRSIPDCHDPMYDCLDHRFQSVQPIQRSVRILEIAPDSFWRVEWFAVVQRLATENARGVCRPLEMGAAGARHVYLVFDRFPAVLADHIPVTGLGNSRLAWSVLRQLLEGLAELHRIGCPHGDFRTQNVYLDTPTLTEQTRVWIGHVELAKLPQWTNGERMDPRTRDIFPPEWNRQLSEPSPAADVYALGLVAVELFAGHKARLNLAPTAGGAPDRLSSLQHRMSWWRRIWLIKPLLAETRRRPKDAVVVQERWHWIQWNEVAVPIVGVPVLAVGLIFAVLWLWGSRFQQELGALQNKLVHAEQSRSEAMTGLAEAQTKIRLLEGLKTPDGLPPIQTGPSVETQAQQLWVQRFSAHSSKEFESILKSVTPPIASPVRQLLVDWHITTQEAWDGVNHSFTQEQLKPGAPKTGRELAYYQLKKTPWKEERKTDLVRALWKDFTATFESPEAKLDAIENTFKKIPVKSWLRPKCQQYIKPLRGQNASWVRWASQPKNLTQTWKQRVSAPWDENAQARELEMLHALKDVEKKWKDVIGRRDLTWDQFKGQLRTAVEDNPLSREIANTWIDQFDNLSSPDLEVTVKVISGSSPVGSGKYRTVDVFVAGALSVQGGHEWSSETSHTYSEPLEISFPWKPGQPIQITVYGGRISTMLGARPTYINTTISGPVALWKLGQDGMIKDNDGKHIIKLEVENCPGPPPIPKELKRANSALP